MTRFRRGLLTATLTVVILTLFTITFQLSHLLELVSFVSIAGLFAVVARFLLRKSILSSGTVSLALTLIVAYSLAQMALNGFEARYQALNDMHYTTIATWSGGFTVVLRLLRRRFGEDQSRLRELAKVLISARTALASGVFFELIWLIAVVNIHGWVLEDLPFRAVMFTAWLSFVVPGLKYWYIRSNRLLAASTLLFTASMLYWIAIGFPRSTCLKRVLSERLCG